MEVVRDTRETEYRDVITNVCGVIRFMGEISDKTSIEIESKVCECCRAVYTISDECESIHRVACELHRNRSLWLADVVSRVMPGLVECSANVSDGSVNIAPVADVALGT